MLCGKSCGRFWFYMALPLLFASNKLQCSLTDFLLKLHVASMSVRRTVYLVTPTPVLMCVWYKSDHKAVVHDRFSAALQRSAGSRVVCWAILGMHSPQGFQMCFCSGSRMSDVVDVVSLPGTAKALFLLSGPCKCMQEGGEAGRLAGESGVLGGCIFVVLLSWVPVVGF